ncbi:hypothetical protein M9H77_12253 [Catharanthus roseus]|uniref:Uncharacterized protein n=1 Tax=Catharanthus roseus TaxID=4058 RepID=A0ACC0BGZ6_CATRO|nr:hypothetical protein M9H77_12253 [Catharanthus roseus]
MVTYFSRGIYIESKQSTIKAHLGSREPSVEPRALIPPVIPRTHPLEMKCFHKISCIQAINFLKCSGAAGKSKRIKTHWRCHNNRTFKSETLNRVIGHKFGHPIVNTNRKRKEHCTNVRFS